jgi:serine protease DegQ
MLRHRMTRTRGIVLGLLLAATACGEPASNVPASSTDTNTAPAAPVAGRLPGLTQLTLAPVVERVTPAVVNIAVDQSAPMENNPLMRDPYFGRLFEVPEQAPALSSGSGVIVDADRGIILTNNHVIESAQRVLVSLKDNRVVEARIVGTDPATDIAVLQIKADNLVGLPLGNSDQMRIGDYVVAIGDPFGIGQTVTSGIVSAKGRGGLIPGGYEDFIQTDAAINPGNSGGALVNMAGQLIGINSAIIGPAGGNVGIGFAVSSNMARAVMDQILKNGKVVRGEVGVLIQDPPYQIGTDAATRPQGALIAGIVANSPAARAGLREGDVVVAADGRPVRSAADLRTAIGLAPVGSTVNLDVRRGEDQVAVSVPVREPAAQPRLRSSLAGFLDRFRSR